MLLLWGELWGVLSRARVGKNVVYLRLHCVCVCVCVCVVFSDEPTKYNTLKDARKSIFLCNVAV